MVAMILVYVVCFVLVVGRQPIFQWTSLEDFITYANQYRSPWADIARAATLGMAFLFVIVMNVLVEVATPQCRLYARIATQFALGFAVLTGGYYFVQISSVRVSLIQESYAGLQQVVQANPYL